VEYAYWRLKNHNKIALVLTGLSNHGLVIGGATPEPLKVYRFVFPRRC
jgi:hypothetical protein